MGKQRKSEKRKNSSGGSNTQSKNARNGGSPVSASVSDSYTKQIRYFMAMILIVN